MQIYIDGVGYIDIPDDMTGLLGGAAPPAPTPEPVQQQQPALPASVQGLLGGPVASNPWGLGAPAAPAPAALDLSQSPGALNYAAYSSTAPSAFGYDQALAKVQEGNRVVGTGSGSPEAAQSLVTNWADWVGKMRNAATFDDYASARAADIRDNWVTQNAEWELAQSGGDRASLYDKWRQQAATKSFDELAAGIGEPRQQLQAEYDYYSSAAPEQIQALYDEVGKGAQDYVSKPGLAQLAVKLGMGGILGGLLGPVAAGVSDSIGGLLGSLAGKGVTMGASKILGDALYPSQPAIDTSGGIGNQLPRANTTAQTAQTGGVPVNTDQSMAGQNVTQQPQDPGAQNPYDVYTNTTTQDPGIQFPNGNPFPTQQQIADAEKQTQPGVLVPTTQTSTDPIATAVQGLLSQNSTTTQDQAQDPMGDSMGLLGAKPWGGGMEVGNPYGPLLWEAAWRRGFRKYGGG